MIAELRIGVNGGRVAELSAPPPLGAKVLPGRRGPTVFLVATAAGLLEGDRLRIVLRVGNGQHLAVRSVAAQLAHPCPGGGSTRLEVVACVGTGGSLDWWPEPLVVCGGASHAGSARLDLGAGGCARWVEEIVLGRSGEEPDAVALRSSLRVDVEGRPLLRDGLDTTLAGFGGPAVAGASRYLGSALLACPGESGPAAGPEWLELAGPGRFTRVLGTDVAGGRTELARRLEAAAEPTHRPDGADRAGRSVPAQ